MSTRFALVVFACLLAGPIVLEAGAQQQAQHQHDQLGSVTFPTSCQPAVQSQFERGVAMLHSYWFSYAGKTFQSVLEQDPSCTMAYWGLAMDLLGNTLSSPPTAAAAKTAWEALEKARATPAKTEREQAWVDAVRAYFRNFDTTPVDVRLSAYNAAMANVAATHPTDFEAQVYYALTLQASAPKSDLTYANQSRSAAMLERLYAERPEHPGITHYLIHAYDFAPFAERGIAAARRYAAIAPAVPHARHMPAHIYSMVGLWEDSIASNHTALDIQPDYYHASDFIVYAHLQLGQDAKAAAMTAQALGTKPRGDRPPGLGDYTARAAMPARLALERADWVAASTLAVTPSPYPQADALTRFTRGLGLARRGDTRAAKAEIGAIDQLRAAVVKSNDTYWPSRLQDQMLAVAAWVAFQDGARTDGLLLMRKAADSEDASVKHVAMENRLYPMRELLGEMLLAAGQPEAARAEFTAVLQQTPNRYRALYGAAKAAAGAGDHAAAARFYTSLVALGKTADGTRTELAEARAYLAAHR